MELEKTIKTIGTDVENMLLKHEVELSEAIGDLDIKTPMIINMQAQVLPKDGSADSFKVTTSMTFYTGKVKDKQVQMVEEKQLSLVPGEDEGGEATREEVEGG